MNDYYWVYNKSSIFKIYSPLSKKSLAVTLPIPVLHPVMMAVLPSNLAAEVHTALQKPITPKDKISAQYQLCCVRRNHQTKHALHVN